MQYPYEPYSGADRRSLLGCAGSALGLVALLLITYIIGVTNPIQRLQLRFFPPRTAVPVSELVASGPLYRGYPSSDVAASTSLDALSRTVLGSRPCPYAPEPRACWGDVQVTPDTLLVAAVPFGCSSSHEWYGWTKGSTLTIDLVVWGCPPFGNRLGVMLPAATYALLGVPLSRLPHGRLLVYDAVSGSQPVAVTVP